MAEMNRFLFAPSVLAAGLCVAAGCGSPKRDLGQPAGAGGIAGSAGDDANSGGRSSLGGTGDGGSSGDGSLADAGAGGEFAEGGDGNAPAACKNDSECNDGKACNGEEICVSDTCQRGRSPCTNVDPVNCEVLCSDVASGAVCGAPQGADADRDGHRSAACQAQPGDDCDDANKNVHPGATEVCDGVDNDCNGKSDVADGLTLSGKTEVLWSNAKSSSIAYSPTENVYGVALSRATEAGGNDPPYNTVLHVLDLKGKATLMPIPVTKITSGYTGATAIAWGGSEFGVAYGDESNDIKFRRVGADGVLHPQVDVDSLNGNVLVSLSAARIAAGNWGIVWQEAFQSFHAARGRTVNAVDITSGQFSFGDGGVRAKIAASEHAFGVAYGQASPTGSSFWLDNRSASFSSQKVQQVIPGSSDGTIASQGSGSGFGLAWLDGANVVFRSFSDAGTPGCGPVTVLANGFVPRDMVSTPRGFLMVSGATKIEALEVSNTCVFGQRLAVDADTAYNIHIAGGAQGFALAWDDGSSSADPKGVQIRLFGPNYCD